MALHAAIIARELLRGFITLVPLGIPGGGGAIEPVHDLSQQFEDLLRSHEKQIYRMAYRLTGNHDDAEDLAQNSVIEALRAFPRFQIGTRFDQWMRRIMMRNFLDGVRSRPRVPVLSLDQPAWPDEDGETLDVPDVTGDPACLLDQRGLDEPLQQALDELPPEFRAAVVLCDVEGCSYDETAAALGVPVGTVRSRLSRGRSLLRRKLAGYLRERCSR